MTNESSLPTDVGSNDGLGVVPERADIGIDWPVARLHVGAHDELAATFYAPGLPTGGYDVWLAPVDATAEIERLRAALEVSQAATNAAVSKAQFQASTNTELNALHDTVRRLRAELCKMLNDGSDA